MSEFHVVLKDLEPCSHPGCLNHITHPCEGCGRIGGMKVTKEDRIAALEAENAALKHRVSAFEEECACLPEDWGIEEYVRHLEGKLPELREAAEKLYAKHESSSYAEAICLAAKAALEDK